MSLPDTAPVEARDVRVSLGRHPVLHGLSLTLPAGSVTGVVGPNGSGKTTLLRAMFRGVRLGGGAVYVAGADAAALGGRMHARAVAAAVQEPSQPEGVTVREVIDLGRYPHRGDLGRASAADARAVADAAATMDLTHLLARDVARLSGGERQRVHVARAIAQEAPALLLDEPTNHLDIAHQFALLSTLRGLSRDRGTAVALALHDLTLAARYCDLIAVLQGGRLAAYGKPDEVLTPELTLEVFGVRAVWGDGWLHLDPAGS
ncbi:ABC transporter ATP-binding protein [Nocardioides speluncae]|uniref:ABC transporter ATP-binding protein n=1 Tax=Nocardioides speluncae TaxID=2670337 RepID=UPI000D6900DC|nr:ABC transporter ATP-binding protein [Nocardioides speluncae]